MKLKVCGLKHPKNIIDIQNLNVDYTGFIFYEKSARHLTLTENLISLIKSLKTIKVGVFVNEEIDKIIQLKQLLNLDYVQLHGNETVEFCKALKKHSKIIKVFKVKDDFDFSICGDFDFVDNFLFETKGKLAGGNGIKFNWQILDKYKLTVPFFLSGGIGIEDLYELKKLNYKKLETIDVNSGFEDEPGLKNIEQLKEFKNGLQSR